MEAQRLDGRLAVAGVALVLLAVPVTHATIGLDDGTLGTSGACEDVTGPERGCLAWADRFDQQDRYDAGRRIEVSPDGERVFVLVQSEDALGNDTIVRALDAESRAPVYDLEIRGHNPAGLAVGAAGERLFVASQDPDTGAVHISSYAADSGNLLETSRIGAIDARHLVHLPQQQAVCLAGSTTQNLSQGQAQVACYGEQTLEKEWSSSFGGENGSAALRLVADSSGQRLFATGVGAVGTSEQPFHPVIAGLDATDGQRLWTFAPSTQGAATGVDVVPSGSSVVATGFLRVSGNLTDAVTWRLDAATGEVEWDNAFDFARDIGGPIEVGPDGDRVYVAGFAEEQILTVAYDATSGKQLWSRTHESGWNANGLEAGRGLSVSPGGSTVYTVGSLPATTNAGSTNYALFAYDAADGTERWYNTYDGPGRDYDIPWDWARSPDGTRLYVTGQSFGQSGHTEAANTDHPLARTVYDSDHNDAATVAFRLDGSSPAVDPVQTIRNQAP